MRPSQLTATIVPPSKWTDAARLAHHLVANDVGSEHDPFTVQTPCATRSGLSPTASNFEPGQAEFPINAQRQALTAGVRIASGRVEKLQGEAGHGRVSSLQANSVPDVVTPQVAHVTQARTDHGAIGEPSPPQALADALARVSLGSGSASSHEAHYRFSSIYEGTLTSDDHIQRAIKIISGSPTVSVGHLQPLLKVSFSVTDDVA